MEGGQGRQERGKMRGRNKVKKEERKNRGTDWKGDEGDKEEGSRKRE